MGLFYTNANYPVTATGVTSPGDLNSLRQGKAVALNVLGLVEIGDAGVYKAARDANIKKVNFIDVNEKAVLFFFFRRITTTVYGE
ncbi:MAG: TRL-like family protein [Bacillus subtilis]|nr:TRL-like family protein [Bacillus subtilis]